MFDKIWFYCFIQVLMNHFAIFTANPIIGKSYKAEISEYPFVVSLSYSSDIIKKENHFCGGTLITRKLVLTSAHCIRGESTDDVMVIIGTSDFSSGKIYTIKSWITYSEWDMSSLLKEYGENYINTNPRSKGVGNFEPAEASNLDNSYLKELLGEDDNDTDDDQCMPVITKNDIAIITLSHDVENVDPAKISVLFHNELIGQNAVTVGWGSVNVNPGHAPKSLLKLNLRILRSFEIKKNYYELFKIKENPGRYYYYTSADPPGVLGSGDSGGPLMLRSTKEIIGVNEGRCTNANPERSQYSMSRHLKLLEEYKEFIEDMKIQ